MTIFSILALTLVLIILCTLWYKKDKTVIHCFMYTSLMWIILVLAAIGVLLFKYDMQISFPEPVVKQIHGK